MINVTELRPGNYFIVDGVIYNVIDILLNKTAMRKMVAKLKVKNVRTGAITEMSENSGYQIETIRLDKTKMTYLYDNGDFLVFMNNDTYEQIEVEKARLIWEIQFLKENSEVEIVLYNDEILGINLPAKVVLKITHCEPAVRGDTVNKALKPATVETGLQIKVPLFIEEGTDVYIKTDSGDYDGRA
ncbi:MAG TPA: elongation factor P [Candidatus Onthovivens sp.]|nr:elongation factor P [Candidatus Onthovivens sp.]